MKDFSHPCEILINLHRFKVSFVLESSHVHHCQEKRSFLRVLSPWAKTIPINRKTKVDETGYNPKLPTFQTNETKMTARMNTT